MIKTGKVTYIENSLHRFVKLNDTEETIYLGSLYKFGNLEIGKEVSFDLIPRYHTQSIVKNPNGIYKYINYFFPAPEPGQPFLIFKNIHTNEIFDLTLSNKDLTFNNNIVGDFYDLSIIPDYKGFDFLPNIIENKNCLNEEVLILYKINIEPYLALYNKHYIVLYKNNRVFISIKDDLDSYVGQTVLMTILRKYISINIQIGNTFYPTQMDTFTFNLSLGENKLISKENNNYILISNRSAITSNNTGKNIVLNYYPIKYGDYNSIKQSKNDSNGFKILAISLYNKDTYIYLFVDINDSKNIFACYFQFEINFDNKLGTIFNFNFTDYYLLVEIKDVIRKDDNINIENYYKLTEFINNTNLIIFSKNNVLYTVDTINQSIADSLIGYYFDLNIIPYLYGIGCINDVN